MYAGYRLWAGVYLQGGECTLQYGLKAVVAVDYGTVRDRRVPPVDRVTEK
jgi:hypothetical protein